MEVQLIRKEPVRAIIERLEAKYHDLAGAEAALPDDPEAMEAVYWFKELRADPSVRDDEATSTSIVDIDPRDLAKLTDARRGLLELVRTMEHASLRDIERASGRDYRNVHADIQILERMGFVQTHRHGKVRIAQAYPAELRIASFG